MGGAIPTDVGDGELEVRLAAAAEEALSSSRRDVSELAFSKALEAIWRLVKELNGYPPTGWNSAERLLSPAPRRNGVGT